ncbi:hypothetical protein OG216_38145 [Streptomycetaceae bacterium NBC_01309]
MGLTDAGAIATRLAMVGLPGAEVDRVRLSGWQATPSDRFTFVDASTISMLRFDRVGEVVPLAGMFACHATEPYAWFGVRTQDGKVFVSPAVTSGGPEGGDGTVFVNSSVSFLLDFLACERSMVVAVSRDAASLRSEFGAAVAAMNAVDVDALRRDCYWADRMGEFWADHDPACAEPELPAEDCVECRRIDHERSLARHHALEFGDLQELVDSPIIREARKHSEWHWKNRYLGGSVH